MTRLQSAILFVLLTPVAIVGLLALAIPECGAC